MLRISRLYAFLWAYRMQFVQLHNAINSLPTGRYFFAAQRFVNASGSVCLTAAMKVRPDLLEQLIIALLARELSRFEPPIIGCV
jgi:hypothetical protein